VFLIPTDRIDAEDTVKIASASQEEWRDLVISRGWENRQDFQTRLIGTYNSRLNVVYGESEINLLEHYLASIPHGELIRGEIEEARFRMINRESESYELESQLQNYGLIIGRIQSGKTGHMLGLALACLSNQKNMKSPRLRSRRRRPASIVILFSSLIDDIRKQTYDRLTNSITERASQDIYIGPIRDKDFTGDTDAQDGLRKFLLGDEEVKDNLILVTKKNHHVINRIKQIFQQTPDPEIRGLSDVIIIDDECDYGSLDANHADQDLSTTETTTNREVRELIDSIRRLYYTKCWYIGYTATPFSNILDNPSGRSHEGLPTLFPRGFIYSISKVTTHLDNAYYFGDQSATSHMFLDVGDEIVPFREDLI
jgi:hypothetical protein